jgi:flagellar basal body rod protein FlgB
MNAENEKKLYTIFTNRTEYQQCRYIVEATSLEQANLLFEDGSAECLDANTIDADEGIEEIIATEMNEMVVAGGAES